MTVVDTTARFGKGGAVRGAMAATGGPYGASSTPIAGVVRPNRRRARATRAIRHRRRLAVHARRVCGEDDSCPASCLVEGETC